MTPRRQQNARPLTVLVVSLLLLLALAALAYRSCSAPNVAAPGGDSAKGDAAGGGTRDVTSANANAGRPGSLTPPQKLAADIDATLQAIRAARATAQNTKDDAAAGYLHEDCRGVRDQTTKDGTLTAADRLVAAVECPIYLRKFGNYHEKLESLSAAVVKLDEVGNKVKELTALADRADAPQPTPGVISWGTVLWAIFVAGVASLMVWTLTAAKSFFNQRDLVAALSRGFAAVDDSLSQLHDTLAARVRADDPDATAPPTAGARLAYGGRQGDGRPQQTSEVLSDEVRQGFSRLQESLSPISDSLRRISGRLSEPSTPAHTERREEPSPRPAPPEPPPAPQPPPDVMLVDKYKEKFPHEASVRAGFQTGYLQVDPEGQLVVLRDGQANCHYLIPGQEWLQTPSFYNQYYAPYYDEKELKTGYIQIIKPAVVRQVGSQWQLEERGTLTTQKQG